ncbi:hypothetical protein TA3x_003915 [Tundrisphaera sp. TA3]|uniref:hypothetical protein n=1 Tax=Tundrisphaera sp. TA3 TaxID=3435775 RepID=UPI003EB8460A
MTPRRRAEFAILLTSFALGVVLVRWADEQLGPFTMPGEGFRFPGRPAWYLAMLGGYRRLQNAWIWACVAATIGMAGLVLLDERWRRPWPAGSILVAVAFLVGGSMAASYVMIAPPISRRAGLCSGLHGTLEIVVPGAVLGAYVGTLGRPIDWRGRLVGGMWLAELGMMIASGLIFG